MSEKNPVLVISGTAAGQVYLSSVLTRIWYTPLLAKTAGQGINLAHKKSPALIIYDVDDLPHSELCSICSVLKNEPSVKGLPLIACARHDRPGEQEALLALGFSAVITKPVDLAHAYETLCRLSEQPRHTPRIPVRMEIVIEEDVPEKVLTCTNLSEGGMYLTTDRPLPENTALHLKFTLPLGTERLEAAAQVVRTVPGGARIMPEPGMGLRFVDIPYEVHQQIRLYVHWKMMGDLKWEPGPESIQSTDDA
ncbi:MAG TPA: hypothetical protein DCO77_05355 [Nitrospiraceae bacterium]|nr:hypothetical protein [Nitrospiraceae bacterium]